MRRFKCPTGSNEAGTYPQVPHQHMTAPQPNSAGIVQGTARKAGRPRDEASHIAILDATKRLACDLPYHQLSIDKIAREAKVAKTTIYRWWPGSTKALLVFEALYQKELTCPDTGSLTGDLSALVKQYMDLHLKPEVAGVQLGLWADLAESTKKGEGPGAMHLKGCRSITQSILDRALARREVSKQVKATLVESALLGAARQMCLFEGVSCADVPTEDFIKIVLRGLDVRSA